jgi:hypothetical protein
MPGASYGSNVCFFSERTYADTNLHTPWARNFQTVGTRFFGRSCASAPRRSILHGACESWTRQLPPPFLGRYRNRYRPMSTILRPNKFLSNDLCWDEGDRIRATCTRPCMRIRPSLPLQDHSRLCINRADVMVARLRSSLTSLSVFCGGMPVPLAFVVGLQFQYMSTLQRASTDD